MCACSCLRSQTPLDGETVTLLSVIVLNWNTAHLLPACLDSVRSTAGHLDMDVWVVDNASADGSLEILRTHFPWVHLIANQENVGFAAGNNRAIAATGGEFVLLFNSDAIATPGSIETLLAVAQAHPRAAIVGARLLNPDGTFQASWSRFPTLAREALIISTLGRRLLGARYPSAGPEIDLGPRSVDYVEGACLLVRRSAINQVGGLDEGYFMYAEEVDWSYSMHAHGWETWYAPDAAIIHLGGGSSRDRKPQREADLYRSRVRFFRKHYGALHANSLKGLLYASTAFKAAAHGLLRLLTNSRRGRTVVSLRQLAQALHDV